MFKKYAGALIVVLTLLTLTPLASAKEVCLNKARLVGAVHVTGQVSGRPILRAMDLATGFGIQTQGVPYFIQEVRELRTIDTNRLIAFIVDLTPQGFVAISTNTNIRPVIAYSFTSSFDLTEHPRNTLLNMLRYDMTNRTRKMEQIPEAIRAQNQKLWSQYVTQDRNLLSALVGATQVGPLLTTRWNQSGFYDDTVNERVPKDPVTCGESPTGCVATAMAQIIRFHEFPPSANFDYDYEFTWDPGDGWGPRTRHLSGTINMCFNYALMPDRLTAPNKQVANLMYAAGVSVEMMYTSYASGAFSWRVPLALHNYFGYQLLELVFKEGTPDFYTRLTDNIKASLPVYLEIHRSPPLTGVHAVVADGWKKVEEDHFHHINFGWAGAYNAWYSLPTMGDGFDIVHSAVFDIIPAPSLYVTPTTITGSVVEGTTTWTNIGTITVANPGGSALHWSETDDTRGVTVYPSEGTVLAETSETVNVWIRPVRRDGTVDLPAGTHQAIATFTGAPPATGSPDTVTITMTVTAPAAFSDDFEDGTLSPWTANHAGRAGVGTHTAQSGIRSLFTRHNPVKVTSPLINLAGAPSAILSVWIRRGCDTFSEDPGWPNEDLVIKYLNSAGNWITLATFLATAGPPGAIYRPIYTLPTDALHSNFRIRFRQTEGSGPGWDYWHIDDVKVVIGS